MYFWLFKLTLDSSFPGVIDYNFLCFRDAITQVFELRNKSQNAAAERTRSGSPETLPNGAADSTGTYEESASDRPQLP